MEKAPFLQEFVYLQHRVAVFLTSLLHTLVSSTVQEECADNSVNFHPKNPQLFSLNSKSLFSSYAMTLK